jgi:peptide/nickel transport system permease protein
MIIGSLRRITRYASWPRIRQSLKGVPWFPLVIMVLFVVVGVFGNQLAPHDPLKINVEIRLLPLFFMKGGSLQYALGTDHLGRDVLSRLIVGTSVSLQVSLVVIAVAASIGALVAIVAGYLGGWVDTILMRLVDIIMSMPWIIIALVFAAVVGAGVRNIIIILAIFAWPGYARVLRGEVLRIKQGDFVRLAVVAGASKARIMLRHIFPNIVNTLVVISTLQVGSIILAEAGLSFIGVGVPPPRPAWGAMAASGVTYIFTDWWLAILPGVAIVLVVMSTNLLGDWLRVRLDPKFRQL